MRWGGAGKYRRKLSLDQIKLMIELYREGWNSQQLADRFGCTRQAILQLLRRRDIEIRPRHPKGANGTNGLARGVREERDEAGVIVTIRNQGTDERLSLHEPGLRLDALRQVVARVDAMGGDWRVICYSTPLTILSDMQGQRALMRIDGQAHPHHPIEATVLSRVKRLDLLDPSLDWRHGLRPS